MNAPPAGQRPREAVRRQRDRGGSVQVLERRDGEAAADHPLDRVGAGRGVGVERHHRQRRLRRGDQPQPGGGDDRERPLRADQQAPQVVAGDVLADRAAERDHLAAGEHRLEPRHPRPRHAVLEGVRPARVGRDVAADLRLLTGARVGREQQAVLAREPPHVRGAQARLDAHPPAQRLERAHARHPLEAEHHAAVERHRSAGEAGAAPARGDRDIALVAPGEQARDLLGARGVT
jgi:hypothetical protein